MLDNSRTRLLSFVLPLSFDKLPKKHTTMILADYLQTNYLTLDTLLERANIKLERLRELQQRQCMPLCSYKLINSIHCKSPIGENENTQENEFYAVGYAEWLEEIDNDDEPSRAFTIFKSKYMNQVHLLVQNELKGFVAPWTNEPDTHLRQEWNHFLAGTYGVCTRNGLPKQIATKELAALRINEIVSSGELDSNQRLELSAIVDLMDSACSEFAPHEREGSSRRRLIESVRERYQLGSFAGQLAE